MIEQASWNSYYVSTVAQEPALAVPALLAAVSLWRELCCHFPPLIYHPDTWLQRSPALGTLAAVVTAIPQAHA